MGALLGYGTSQLLSVRHNLKTWGAAQGPSGFLVQEGWEEKLRGARAKEDPTSVGLG